MNLSKYMLCVPNNFPLLVIICLFFSENINFLTADGVQFAHPLHHLGKAKKDLPLIAIDSFKHMYLFPGVFNMNLLMTSKHSWCSLNRWK